VRKEWWRLMSPQKSGDEVHETVLKKRGEKRAMKKNERKREKGQCYYPFSTLVLQSSTMFFIYRVSYAFIFIY
jgi:hypothetical protein